MLSFVLVKSNYHNMKAARLAGQAWTLVHLVWHGQPSSDLKMSLLSQCTFTACHAVASHAGASICKVLGLGNFHATDVYSLCVAGRQAGDLHITPATGHVAAAAETARGGLLSVSASRTGRHQPRQMVLAPIVSAASCLRYPCNVLGTTAVLLAMRPL